LTKEIKLKFDSDLPHQINAISAVVDVFNQIENNETLYGNENKNDIFSNYPLNLNLNDEVLRKNIIEVQIRNGISSVSNEVFYDEGKLLEELSPNLNDAHRCPHFTVEMETGTGKTYVYLRTIYELKQKNNFKKFIIVVPSIAIYEGVIQSFFAMEGHFKYLYNNEILTLYPYDGMNKQNEIKNFSLNSNGIDVLLISLDSFNKVNYNNLFKDGYIFGREELPYQFIQNTRPIIILDEPQTKFGTEKNSQAIRSLKPLFVLRYSATHKNFPNLLFKLSPFESYHNKLVKKIEVIGLENNTKYNGSLVLKEVKRVNNKITASILCWTVLKNGEKKDAEILLNQGDDLYLKSNYYDYKDYNYIVKEIYIEENKEYILFENGEKLFKNNIKLSSLEDLFRSQIRQTIWTHIEKQNKLYHRGIKVLSLFFVDKVSNYVKENNKNGMIKDIFEEEYECLKNMSSFFTDLKVRDIQAAYFAKRQIKNSEEYIELNEEKWSKEQRLASKRAFELIMKDKSSLLSFSSPVSFIFAHSALKEGWDNPNVFQICTLNQTKSTIKKRQEIGRGLRLCIDQTGKRIIKEDPYFELANRLTIVANENYEKYADTLQNEYQEEGFTFLTKTLIHNDKDKKNKVHDKLNEKNLDLTVDQNQIQNKFHFNNNMEIFIQKCIAKLNLTHFPDDCFPSSRGVISYQNYYIYLHEFEHDFVKIKIVKNINDKKPFFVILKIGESLSKYLNDQNLFDYNLTNIYIDNNIQKSFILFENGKKLTYTSFLEFNSLSSILEEENRVTAKISPPYINLLQKVSDVTNLTRHSIFDIFKGLTEDRKMIFLKNPDKFINIFISKILSLY
jgi:type III restriction enzyme